MTKTNSLRLRALLIDLNGTLHVGRDATPGAVRAIQRLRAARIPFLFCSNSTRESDKRLLAKMTAIGFDIEPHELLTSIGACRLLVEEKKLRPYLLMAPEAKEEFAHLDCSSPHDSVILGLDEASFNYSHLNMAFRILKAEPLYSDQDRNVINSGESSETTSKLGRGSGTVSRVAQPKEPILIAPHAAMFQQTGESETLPAGLSIGIGPFVRALELASGVSAHIVGKPTQAFYEMAITRLRSNASASSDGRDGSGEYEDGVNGSLFNDDDVAIVGDDVVNDLGEGALALGLTRVLVKTGKYRPGVEETTTKLPDAVFDTFSDLVDAVV